VNCIVRDEENGEAERRFYKRRYILGSGAKMRRWVEGTEVVDVSERGASFGVRASQPRAKFVT
jgi:hypothetical protein